MEGASLPPFSIPPAGPANAAGAPDGDAVRAAFDAGTAYSVGIEDEVMLVDPVTLELVSAGPQVIGRLGGDDRFKLELPASQLEIVTTPSTAAGALGGPLL